MNNSTIKAEKRATSVDLSINLLSILKKEFLNFKKFFFQNKFLLVISAIFTIATFGEGIVSYYMGMDSELRIVGNPDTWTLMKAWFAQGRYGMAILVWIFNTVKIVPFWSKYISAVILFISSWVLSYFFTNASGKNNIGALLVSCFFICSPLHSYYMYYDTYNVGMSVAILLISIFLPISSYYATQKTSLGVLVFSSFFLSFLIGVYQSFAALYITSVLLFLLIQCVKMEDITWKKTVQEGLRFAVILVIAMIINFITKNLCMSLLNISDEYTNLYIQWGSGISNCVNAIISSVRSLLASYVGYGLLIIFLLSGVLLIFFSFRKKSAMPILLYLGTLLSTILMRILIGGDMPIRTDQAIVFGFAGLAYVAYLLISQFKIQWFQIAYVMISFIMFLNLSQISASLQASNATRYMQDLLLANNINTRIENELGGPVDRTVVFVGLYQQPTDGTLVDLTFDQLGWSTFLWTSNITHVRQNNFMVTQGYGYSFPNLDEAELAYEISQDMPIWPAENSIKITDSLIIVKLGYNG